MFRSEAFGKILNMNGSLLDLRTPARAIYLEQRRFGAVETVKRDDPLAEKCLPQKLLFSDDGRFERRVSTWTTTVNRIVISSRRVPCVTIEG